MKTLIKKEIRLLLPAWITAMLLAIVPRFFLIVCPPGYFFPLSFFAELMVPAGLLFLGINSFGQELSCNTFSALLSQPMDRSRIWRVKVATLAAAFISVWLTAILFVSWQFGVIGPQFTGALESFTLSALVAFSGGLWTTLLLRQMTTAFWFTVLTPLAIIIGIIGALNERIVPEGSANTLTATALVLYSIAGFILAWRLFMRAQDVPWTGGEISLPHRQRVSKTRTGSLAFRTGHRFSALTWKELQLHQGTFLIAAIVLVLHLTSWFIRKFHLHIQNSSLQFILAAVWLLWLLMPLLIGAAAIAEERRMGTLEPQFSLPVSRGAQLLVKFCIGLVLSLFFGGLVPVLIEGTIDDQWPWIFAIAAALFFVSFYASSLGRTTLQAIGWAILLGWVIHIQESGLFPPRFAYYTNPDLEQFEFEHLTGYLNAAILAIALGWLTFSNFKHVHQNYKFWFRNITAILAVVLCVPYLARAIWSLSEFFVRRGTL